MTFQELAEEYIIYTVKNFKFTDIKNIKRWMKESKFGKDFDTLVESINLAIEDVPQYWENFLPTIKDTLPYISLNDTTFLSYWDTFWSNADCEESIPNTFEEFISKVLYSNTNTIIFHLIKDLYFNYKKLNMNYYELSDKEKEIYEKIKKRLT